MEARTPLKRHEAGSMVLMIQATEDLDLLATARMAALHAAAAKLG
jgi:hypothetical protein